jgi:outer membrane protein
MQVAANCDLRRPPLRFTAMPRLALLLAGSLAVGASFAPTAKAADVAPLKRVAIVNVQRCILETTEGKRAKQDLEKTFAKGQARLDRKAKALEKRMRDLQAKAAMLSQSELMKRQEDILRAQGELEQLGMDLQEEVMQKEALLTEKIYNKVASIVKQIALEEDLQVVLVRSEMTVLWANPKLDVTNRVIVRYDKKHK